jgi:hypothetical protein
MTATAALTIHLLLMGKIAYVLLCSALHRVYQGVFVHTASRQLAVRSYLAAGVAIVGASAIAVSPMAPPMPDIHLPSLHEAGVELSALADPFAAYGQAFDNTVANLQAVLATAAKNPTPVLTKVLSNQLVAAQALLALLPTVGTPASGNLASNLTQVLASQPGVLQELVTAIQTAIDGVSTALQTTVPPILEAALTDLKAANIEGAVNNVLLAGFAGLFPVTGVITPALNVVAAPLQAIVNAVNTIGPVGVVVSNPLQNVVNVLNVVGAEFLSPATNADLALAGLLGPAIEGVAATGTAIQGVINAAGAGNPGAALGAVLDVPAVIADGFLNGGVGPDLSGVLGIPLGVPIYAGGLLTQFGFVFSGDSVSLNLPGAVAAIQTLQGLIAGALTPPAIPKAQVSTFALAKADSVTAAPTALPSLKSALVGLKTPHALTAKPAKASDTTADTKTADSTAAADAKPAASDAGSDTGNQPTTTRAKHRASAGDTGGKHTRSHDSSDAGKGGKGGSGGGRHHAA